MAGLRLFRLVPIALALVASASSATPDGNTVSDGGARPAFHLWITGLDPQASLGGFSADMTYVFSGVGQTAHMFVRSGPASDFCMLENSDRLTAKFVQAAAIYWSMEVRVVSYDRAGAEFDLRWRRVVQDPAASDAGPFDGKTQVRLTPGPEQVIDLVRPRTADSICSGLSIGVAMSFKENEALANSLLQDQTSGWSIGTASAASESTT